MISKRGPQSCFLPFYLSINNAMLEEYQKQGELQDEKGTQLARPMTWLGNG